MTDLASYLHAASGRAFRYGRHDCVTFGAGWVLARTGRDLLAGLDYGSLREGRAILAAAGHEGLADAAGALLPEIQRLRAQPGDLALVRGGFGIVTGPTIACLDRHRGLTHWPLTEADAVYRVE
jgi:hypothetical protein